MASSGMWSLCLVSSGTRKVVKVDPSKDSIQDLYRIAAEAFGTDGTSGTPSSVASLKAGFPPQPLDANDTIAIGESKKVSNQERVHVVLEVADAVSSSSSNNTTTAKKQTKGRSKKAATEATTETPSSPATAAIAPGRRPRRAAAQAATESFAGVIKEQNRILKAEKKPAAKRKATKAKPPQRVAKKSSPSPTFASQAPGRRLNDGAVIGSPAKKKQKSTTKSSSSQPALPAGKKKYEDMSVALMGALDDKGSMGRILRKGMSNAVLSSYESTKATTRLAALESRTPQLSVQMERIDGDTGKLRVKFEKGVQGKGFYEEVVDWIPVDVLQQVVNAIYKSNPEGLRSHNLSFLSPRVLWALAFSHSETQRERQQQQVEAGSWEPFSLEATYRKLLPDNDWSFLRRRKQQLSAKAMENNRQDEKDDENENDAESAANLEEAAGAIQEVEQAMENLQQYDRTKRAERVANAAVARHQRQQGSQQQQQQQSAGPSEDLWKLETPPDLDEEELVECIATNPGQDSDESSQLALAKGLVEWASIHNWRELAHHHPTELHACIAKNNKPNFDMSEEQVQAWIQYAREQSVDEIIVEICDGNIPFVELLREKMRSGTPKDLAGWKAMPDLLLEGLGEATGDSPSLEDVTQYCNRAQRALQEWEWLNWFASPVE